MQVSSDWIKTHSDTVKRVIRLKRISIDITP